MWTYTSKQTGFESQSIFIKQSVTVNKDKDTDLSRTKRKQSQRRVLVKGSNHKDNMANILLMDVQITEAEGTVWHNSPSSSEENSTEGLIQSGNNKIVNEQVVMPSLYFKFLNSYFILPRYLQGCIAISDVPT